MNGPDPSTYRRLLHAAVAEATRWGDASSLVTLGEHPVRLSETEVRDLWAAAPTYERDGIHHVYVHVPFCKSICTFCNYKRLRPSSPQLLDRYLDRVESSLRTLAPGTRKHRFETLYLGGGTPTILPAAKLDRLLTMLDEHLRFAPGGRRVAEADPAVLGEARARVLAQHGVHHVSMGVQTLDTDVVRAHDRGAQDVSVVERQVDHLVRAGIDEFSFDLIVGLKDTTPASILSDLDRLLGTLQPKWVDIYALTPTHRYVDLQFGGDFQAFHDHQRPFLEDFGRGLAPIARRHGYTVGGSPGHYWSVERRDGVKKAAALVAGATAHLASRALAWAGAPGAHDALRLVASRLGIHAGPSYTQLVSLQDRPLHLLGLGYSARSHIFGQASFTYEDPDDDPMNPGPAHYIGRTYDMHHEARTYLLHRWRDGQTVDRRLFARIFGMDLDAVAGEALAAWRGQGRVRTRGPTIALDLPPRAEGIQTLMWLFPLELLEHTLAVRRDLVFDEARILDALRPFEPGGEVCDGWRWSQTDPQQVTLSHDDGSRVVARIVPALPGPLGATLRLVRREGPADPQRAVAALRAAMDQRGASSWGRLADSRPKASHPAAQL